MDRRDPTIHFTITMRIVAPQFELRNKRRQAPSAESNAKTPEAPLERGQQLTRRRVAAQVCPSSTICPTPEPLASPGASELKDSRPGRHGPNSAPLRCITGPGSSSGCQPGPAEGLHPGRCAKRVRGVPRLEEKRVSWGCILPGHLIPESGDAVSWRERGAVCHKHDETHC